MDRRLLTRIVLRNYKSIAACDVSPAQLSFLVGPNGSGKSNFLDALRFIADSLRFSLDHALRDRGGVIDVRRRSRAVVPRISESASSSTSRTRGGTMRLPLAPSDRVDMRSSKKSAEWFNGSAWIHG